MIKKGLVLIYIFFFTVPFNTTLCVKPNGYVLMGIGNYMGLGKIAEYFSGFIKLVARSQGNTRGHRVIKRPGEEFKLCLIPSGIMRKGTTCYLTAGMELDP